jgi:hypothetical protein
VDLRRFQSGVIKLVYPSILDGVVAQATDGVRPYVPGRTFQLLPGGACEDADGNCIRVGVNLFSCKNPTACGCGQRGAASAETYTHASRISLRNNWEDDRFKVWVISHELAHILGLEERADAPCAPASTVMNSEADCNVVPDGQAILATSSDGIAIADGMYGNGMLKTCGWK